MVWDGVVKVNGGNGLTLDNPFSPFPFSFPFLFLNRIIFLVNKKRVGKEKYDISTLPPNPKKGNCKIFTYVPTYIFLFGMK